MVRGIEFRSVTVTARKGKQGPCYEANQAVIYRGPWKQVEDDDGHVLRRGERAAVCAKTYGILTAEPYADQVVADAAPRVVIPENERTGFDCSRTAFSPSARDEGAGLRDHERSRGELRARETAAERARDRALGSSITRSESMGIRDRRPHDCDPTSRTVGCSAPLPRAPARARTSQTSDDPRPEVRCVVAPNKFHPSVRRGLPGHLSARRDSTPRRGSREKKPEIGFDAVLGDTRPRQSGPVRSSNIGSGVMPNASKRSSSSTRRAAPCCSPISPSTSSRRRGVSKMAVQRDGGRLRLLRPVPLAEAAGSHDRDAGPGFARCRSCAWDFDRVIVVPRHRAPEPAASGSSARRGTGSTEADAAPGYRANAESARDEPTQPNSGWSSRLITF